MFVVFPQVFSLKSSANADGQVVSATISLIAAESWTFIAWNQGKTVVNCCLIVDVMP